jgi:addiction module RelB/DinJ family antitoxin
MKKEVINIKTDKKLKEKAQSIADELGLTLTDVINSSLRNLIRTRKVVFSAIPRMTSELERILGPIEKDIQSGRNISRGLSSDKEIDDFLK